MKRINTLLALGFLPTVVFRACARRLESPYCTYPYDREQFIQEQISCISSAEDLSDPLSPQSRALNWLIYNDTSPIPDTYRELAQRYASATFYLATNGPSWDESAGWLSEENECDWYGLICNEFDHVTGIYLESNLLDGFVPHEISQFPELEEFWAGSNSLTGEIPNVFSEMPQLMEIRLDNNNLEGPIPDVPDSLTVFDVSNNKLEGEIPFSVYEATGLTDLILKDNNLVGSLREEIGDLTQLEELWLNFNNFTGLIPDTIASLTHMVKFVLEKNEFEGEFPDVFYNWTELDFFDIGLNKFSGPIPGSIFGIAPVRIVYMSNNTFTGPLPNFSQAQSLKDLWVSGNILNGSVPDMIGPFVDFSELLVYNNDLTGIMPDSVCQLRDESDTFISLHADCAPDPFPDGPIKLFCDCCTQCSPFPPVTQTTTTTPP